METEPRGRILVVEDLMKTISLLLGEMTPGF